MTASSQPFGLRPAYHPSGLDRARALAGGITSGYSVNILKGQPVWMTTTANAANGATVGTISAATAGSAFVGAFHGVEWTDVTGRRRVSNYWPASTTYIASSCLAYYYDDPQIVYEIQADGSVPVTAIGNEADFTNITAGSTTTGLSAATLSSTLKGSGVQGQMRIIDFAKQVDNVAGDAFTMVRAILANTQLVTPVTALA